MRSFSSSSVIQRHYKKPSLALPLPSDGDGRKLSILEEALGILPSPTQQEVGLEKSNSRRNLIQEHRNEFSMKQSLQINGLQVEHPLTFASQTTANPSLPAFGVSPEGALAAERKPEGPVVISAPLRNTNNSIWPLRDEGASRGWNHAQNSAATNKMNDEGVARFSKGVHLAIAHHEGEERLTLLSSEEARTKFQRAGVLESKSSLKQDEQLESRDAPKRNLRIETRMPLSQVSVASSSLSVAERLSNLANPKVRTAPQNHHGKLHESKHQDAKDGQSKAALPSFDPRTALLRLEPEPRSAFPYCGDVSFGGRPGLISIGEGPQCLPRTSGIIKNKWSTAGLSLMGPRTTDVMDLNPAGQAVPFESRSDITPACQVERRVNGLLGSDASPSSQFQTRNLDRIFSSSAISQTNHNKIKKAIVNWADIDSAEVRAELPEGSVVEVVWGINLNELPLTKKPLRFCIPATDKYKLYKYKNPKTQRLLKILKCEFSGCDRVFRKWHNFYDHLRIHTRERPFDCPYKQQLNCALTFTQKSNLNKHVRAHQLRNPGLLTDEELEKKQQSGQAQQVCPSAHPIQKLGLLGSRTATPWQAQIHPIDPRLLEAKRLRR